MVEFPEDVAFWINGTPIAWLDAGLGPYDFEFGVTE
jgi:hypothetical protein